MTKALVTILCLPLALAASCVTAAVVVSGLIINDELRDNSIQVTIPEDPDTTWASVKSTLGHMTEELLEDDDDTRVARTMIDGATVTVGVERYQVGETRIYVNAQKYMLNNSEIADIVQRRIIDDLQR